MTDGRTLGIDWTPGEVPALLGLTAIAIYGCVPETSNQMPAIGVMLASLFVIELIARRPSAPLVHAVAAGIVLWSGLYGATGRESAIVGALFAFWPLVLVVIVCHWPGRCRAEADHPLGHRADRRDRRRGGRPHRCAGADGRTGTARRGDRTPGLAGRRVCSSTSLSRRDDRRR